MLSCVPFELFLAWLLAMASSLASLHACESWPTLSVFRFMMIGSVSVPMKVAGNERKASVNNTTATFKGTKNSTLYIPTPVCADNLSVIAQTSSTNFQHCQCNDSVNTIWPIETPSVSLIHCCNKGSIACPKIILACATFSILTAESLGGSLTSAIFFPQ